MALAVLICSSAAWPTSSDSNPSLSSGNTTPSGLTRMIGAKLRTLNARARDVADVMFTPSRMAGRTRTFQLKATSLWEVHQAVVRLPCRSARMPSWS